MSFELIVVIGLGGWQLFCTLHGKFYKIRSLHSFATQLTSALVIPSASFVGLPVSTTQIVSSAIIGVGSSERLGKVRLSVADDILITWIVTILASALLSGCIYWLVENFT
jgi:inorganic phosphate transporter, PiT family